MAVALLALAAQLTPLPAAAVTSTLVASGATLYNTDLNALQVTHPSISPYSPGSCAAACHFANPAPDTTQPNGSATHPLAANNSASIALAWGTGGLMTGNFGTNPITSPSATQRDRMFKLALYIGQYKAAVFKTAADGACPTPTLTIKVRAGASATLDAYPCLATDGSSGVAQDSGGLSVPANTARATSITAVQDQTSVGSVSQLAYNVRYTAAATATGSDNFTLGVTNPTGTTNKTIAAEIYGITSGSTALVLAQGQTYSRVYDINSNDSNATFSADLSTAAALSTIGLSIDAASGVISGTPTGAAGAYTLRVTANISATTVGAANAGPVTKNIALTIGGITSTGSVNATQDQALTTYTITSNVAVIASSYTLSSVPPGLSFNSANGQLTGTPTVQGTTNASMGATIASTTDVGTSNQTISASLTIVVASAGPPVLTSNLPAAPTVTGTVNTSVNGSAYTLSANRPPLGNFVLVGANPLPTGLSLNATTGAITGTPTVSGDFPVSLRTSNSAGNSNQLDLTLRINPIAVPVISSANTAMTNVNQPFGGYQIVASNAPVLSYATVAPSTLPVGLSLNPASGQITGTPTVSGIVATDLRATNAAGNSATFTVTFTIVPTSLPTVTVPLMAAPLVTGTVGAAITPIQISATNNPITGYGATGLPTGLSVDGTGRIVGTPTLSGDFAVVASATNTFGTGVAPSVTIRISPNTVPAINSAASLTRNVNAASGLVYQITATNPLVTTYAIVPPSVLPAGLTLNTASGAISGSPSASGSVQTMLSASNAAGTSAPFTLSFTIDPIAVPIASAPLLASPAVTGTVGSAIAPIQIAAINPLISAYGATGLPGGLSVNVSGQIVGTPTQSGDFSVTVNATNVVGTGANSAPVTIRINPNIAPVIGSANTATAAANVAFGGYQLIASNGPITSYAVVAPSQLPVGLSLDSATGSITGTATTSGSVQTTLSATNASGTSAPFTLSFTVNPSTVPTITSPTFVSMAAGVAITPIQIVATNPALLEYLASSLPPGLALNAVSGTISGTPTTPGSFSVVLGARNVVGTGNLAVPFTVGIPTPGACTMSVPLNTPTTLDLASCLFAGFAPTGVSIVATPAHGNAVANGTQVTFTPANNYFGTDSFTFVGSGAGGTSPQGTVTVTVTGRPDPAQDAVVTRMLSAQTETAQRFAGAQISNFQRRMESLHRGPGASGRAGLSVQVQPAPAAGAFASASTVAGVATTAASIHATNTAVGSTPLLSRPGADVNPQMPGGITSLAANHTPTVARESEVLDALAAGLGIKSMPLAEGAISLIRNRSVNLAGVASGMGLNTSVSDPSSTSYWIEGVATFGTRDATGAISGSEFSSSGITVGVDRRYDDQLALGMGLGYARDKTLIGTDGSESRAKGYSLAVYGSYAPTPETYIDALLGVASLDFDTRRFVAPMNDFALGKRSGTQWFGSLTGGYEFRATNLLVSPYGRLDFSVDRLDTSTETGAGPYALTYFDQSNTSIQGALGVRGESIHATGFGYAVPRLRVEYRHEFKRAGQAFIGYADQIGGPRFAVAPAGGPRDSIALGLGSDFIMRDGLTLSLEYQLSHSFSNASTHALRLRLSKDFDVRGLPRLMVEEVQHGPPSRVQVEAGMVHDDNITRAKSGPDVLSDSFYALNVSKTFVTPLSDVSRLLLTATAGGDKFRNYNGLSRLHGSGEAEYQYRASSEFDEPTYGVFAKFTAEGFESHLRDGYRFTTGVSVRQALTDRIGIFAAVSHNRRNASSDVFSTIDNSVRGNIDYVLSDNEILYVGAEYRRGDIVSTGRASLENVTVANVFAQDDAYAGGQLFSYRFRGSTTLLTMGYNLGLGPQDSIDFSWRHIRSTPGLRPGFVTSPRSYLANQLSAVYLMRF